MFLALYLTAIALMFVYFGMLIKLYGYIDITRGLFISYVAATFIPIINLFVAAICTIIMAGMLFEKYRIGEWFEQPLINPDKESK